MQCNCSLYDYGSTEKVLTTLTIAKQLHALKCFCFAMIFTLCDILKVDKLRLTDELVRIYSTFVQCTILRFPEESTPVRRKKKKKI